MKSSIGLASLRINRILFIFTYDDYGPPVMGLRPCFAMLPFAFAFVGEPRPKALPSYLYYLVPDPDTTSSIV